MLLQYRKVLLLITSRRVHEQGHTFGLPGNRQTEKETYCNFYKKYSTVLTIKDSSKDLTESRRQPLNTEIEQLTELQVIDLQIAKLDVEKDTKLAELREQEKIFGESESSVAELKEKKEVAEARRREIEAELSDELSRLKERQSKMMQVQTNREYQSLLKEIEDGKKKNKEREDEIVQLMEAVEADTIIMDEQAGAIEEGKEALEKGTKEAEKFARSIDRKKAKIVKKRNTMAKKIDAPTLRQYDKLRAHRNGKAICAVINGICQGCFMSIPPQHFNNILRGDKMLSCPTCQRILYYQPESTEE